MKELHSKGNMTKKEETQAQGKNSREVGGFAVREWKEEEEEERQMTHLESVRQKSQAI